MSFFTSRYFKDIFSQAGLVIAAQLIPVVSSPLLSRIYDQNAMAEITGLMALSSILLVFSTFKLENAVVTEKDDNRANQLMVLGIGIALLFSIVTIFLVNFFSDRLGNSFKIQNVINFVPFYVLFLSALNIINFWFVRIKKFKLKAYSKIIENGSYVAFACSIYYLKGQNELGLALGKFVGVCVAMALLFAFSKLKFQRNKWNTYKDLLVDYKEFPLHYMPSSFVNVMSLQMLILFIGIYYSKEQLGYFGLANMVVLLPISFITQSVGTIFFQKMSEYINKGQGKLAKKTFKQTLGMLAAIGIPAFLVLYFGSVYLFPFVFGFDWEITGIIAKLLAVVFLSQIIVGPISIVLISLKKIKLNAFWQYGRFVIMLLYMLSLVYFFNLDFLSFVKWYAYGAATLYTIYFLIIINEVRVLRDED
ncbi:lipopolysaccharide biosynthesis protein [Maribacter aestuarii]|uniref:lipopolysaccharide biosynthesis protein n=1 Tax=Maribacter aestuarii TaxID=1130723 RepID=UPI00248D1DEF|nr:oligosaccharide flippase family protein [Maribacter aestuarii]